MKSSIPTFLSKIAVAALMPLAAAQAVGVHGQGTWETTLQPRDINGDGTVDAFYDTVLNITWLANGNAGAGSSYDSSVSTTSTDGRMTWANANAWATSLNVYGKSGWRLPTMIDTGSSGCNWSLAGGTDCGYNVQTISADGKTVFSEMAYLYYVSLGNKSYCTPGDVNCKTAQPGWGGSNTGAFRNLQASIYWSGGAYAPYASDRVYFSTNDGVQYYVYQSYEMFALAVRPGDVAAAVPEPETWALMLAGMGAVAVALGRKST